DGETVRARLARGPQPPLDALDVAVQAAGALRAAHAANIVHRDIKPENLMIRRDGYVKVLDFGLAKLTADEQRADTGFSGGSDRLTRAGTVLGTQHYMAPEQAAGQAVDARSDLYSLTVVLVEMLTGALPREGGDPRDDLAKLPIPAALVDVISHGLARDPAARIQSADDLKEALEDAKRELTDAPLRARRRRLSAVALSAALAVAAALSIFWNRIFPAAPSVQSIAVLPFVAAQADAADQSHLSVGLADAVATRLGEVPQLRLTPTATVRHFINTARTPSDVGRELGVDAVLTGSVAHAGDRLRLAMRLIRVNDGRELWSGRYDEPFNSVFAVRDAFTEKGASALVKDAGKRGRHPRRETSSSAAYELYLRGREQWARRTPSSVRAAIDLFQRSIETEPSFGLAYA